MARNPNSMANLTPKSSTEARRNGAKGGKASGEAKRRRKTLKEELLAMLEDPDVQEGITVSLIKQAKEGNTKAYEIIRDTIGEKPIERIEQKNVEVLVSFEE